MMIPGLSNVRKRRRKGFLIPYNPLLIGEDLIYVEFVV